MKTQTRNNISTFERKIKSLERRIALTRSKQIGKSVARVVSELNQRANEDSPWFGVVAEGLPKGIPQIPDLSSLLWDSLGGGYVSRYGLFAYADKLNGAELIKYLDRLPGYLPQVCIPGNYSDSRATYFCELEVPFGGNKTRVLVLKDDTLNQICWNEIQFALSTGVIDGGKLSEFELRQVDSMALYVGKKEVNSQFKDIIQSAEVVLNWKDVGEE